MAYVSSYSHLTIATIPEKSWDEAWLALQTWKGLLQSFPGHAATRISARALDNGDVRLGAATVWDYPEELEEWRERRNQIRDWVILIIAIILWLGFQLSIYFLVPGFRQ